MQIALEAADLTATAVFSPITPNAGPKLSCVLGRLGFFACRFGHLTCVGRIRPVVAAPPSHRNGTGRNGSPANNSARLRIHCGPARAARSQASPRSPAVRHSTPSADNYSATAAGHDGSSTSPFVRHRGPSAAPRAPASATGAPSYGRAAGSGGAATAPRAGAAASAGSGIAAGSWTSTGSAAAAGAAGAAAPTRSSTRDRRALASTRLSPAGSAPRIAAPAAASGRLHHVVHQGGGRAAAHQNTHDPQS